MFTLWRAGDASPVHARNASGFSKILSKATAEKHGKVLKLKRTGRMMIDAMKNDNKPGWKHTYKREGQAERLIQALQNVQALKKETTQFFTGHVLESLSMDDLLEKATTTKVQPGAFVETRRNDIVTNGVVIATELHDNQNDTLTLTTTGEYWAHRSTDIMFSIPDFIDPFLIGRCGHTMLHATPSELAARLKVLNQARNLERAVETEEHKVAKAIKDLYHTVRADAPDAWGRVSTIEAARKCKPNPRQPIVTLFAVHKQLMERSTEYVCQSISHLATHEFDVRPLSHLHNLQRVLEWLRTKDPCVKRFQEKAQVLVDASRKLEKDSEGELPTRVPDDKMPNIRWTPTDHELIKVLKLSLLRGRKIQRNPYDTVVPGILKAVKRYDDLDLSAALQFLQEIGVYTPWEDVASKTRELNLYQGPLMPDPLVSGLIADPHESVRHDFGDLPVYVIDDFGAEELDDGVSIERIPNEPGSVWVHVHVADPTAVLPLEHEITKQARAKQQSSYFIHRSWAMLPKELSSICDMGIGIRKAQRALTFSAKLDGKGELLDYTVRPSIVRNVMIAKYDDVDTILGERAADYVFSPFEHSAKLESRKDWDVTHLLPFANELKALFSATRALVQHRNDRGVFAFSWQSPELSVRPKPLPINPVEAEGPVLYRGFPELRFTVGSHLSRETGARSLVAECMKLACRIASKFASDHSIPLIRRTIPPIASGSSSSSLPPSTLERVLSARDRAGYVDPVLLLRLDITFPSGRATLDAQAGHWGLGVRPGEGGYARATSPLRRFADMVAHWQLKSVLLPRSDPAFGRAPPFDEDALRVVMGETTKVEMVARRAEAAHRRYWTHLYVLRWMERMRGAPPTHGDGSALHPLQALEGIVTRPMTIDLVKKQPFVEVLLPKLGMPALLTAPSVDYVKEIGDKIRVRIVGVEKMDLNPSLMVKLAE